MDAHALHGTFPAAVTPLHEDRSVHLEDVASVATAARRDGATGVLVAGSTGEGTLLSATQRAEVTATARAALDADDGGVLLAGASGPTIDELHEDVARLAEAGADAVLVLAPHTYPLQPEELVDLHATVADRAPVPTLAYHIPQLTGSALTPDTLADLARHPNIIGAKDSSPDGERRAAFAAATTGIDGFSLLTGHAPTARQARDDGVDGVILAVGTLHQRSVTQLWRAIAAGDDAAATRHQQTLTATSEALAAVPGSTPAVLKAALQLRGLIEERWCRPPLRSIGPGTLDRVRTALLR